MGMQGHNGYKYVLAAAALLLSGIAAAQDVAADQASVWAVVEKQWNSVEDGDRKWIDELLVDDFAGWPSNSPAPRNKASTKMWNRFGESQGKLVAHELYPLGIIVRGDVAVAHYVYRSAYKDKDDNVEMNNGRYSDVLVRTDDGWKFLAWHGGDDQ
jgi:ketosteroid isomerase-like protein